MAGCGGFRLEMGEMPKKVAEVFPNFNFYCIEQTESYGVAANSEATMKNGEFVCIAGDSDGNFGKKDIGHTIDGNVIAISPSAEQ